MIEPQGEAIVPAPDPSLKILKLFLAAINSDLVEVGLSRPLELQDLSNLDSDTFVKLLIYLLTDSGVYTVDQLAGKTEVLLKLTEAGLPRLEYDATLDYVFWAVKRILPEGDDFSYSLLLNPKSNPKAVKHIIHYITAFNVFAENCSEVFERVNAEVHEESLKRNELHRQIDEINAKIAEKLAEMQEKKEVLPSLKLKLNEINSELRTEEEALVEIETEVRNYKKTYDAEEQEKLHLEMKLQEIMEEKARLESQVVSNPEILQKTHKDEKLKLEALIQEREAIGQKMEQLSVEDTSVVELIERATSLSSQLEECIESMVEIHGIADEQRETDVQLKSLETELRLLISKLKHCNADREKAKEQSDSCCDDMTMKVKDKEIQLASLKQRISELKQKLNRQAKQKSELQSHIEEVNSENKLLQERYQRAIYYVNHMFPAEVELLDGSTKEFLKGFRRDL